MNKETPKKLKLIIEIWVGGTENEYTPPIRTSYASYSVYKLLDAAGYPKIELDLTNAAKFKFSKPLLRHFIQLIDLTPPPVEHEEEHKRFMSSMFKRKSIEGGEIPPLNGKSGIPIVSKNGKTIVDDDGNMINGSYDSQKSSSSLNSGDLSPLLRDLMGSPSTHSKDSFSLNDDDSFAEAGYKKSLKKVLCIIFLDLFCPFSNAFFRTSLCVLRTHIESRFCNPHVVISHN
jgi:hypothetical protein